MTLQYSTSASSCVSAREATLRPSVSADPRSHNRPRAGNLSRVVASAQRRALTENEAALLRLIVAALDGPTADTIAAQIAATTVVGGLPTMLDLAVATDVDAALVEDGPLPVRATTPNGEVLVWVTAGFLSALEYAWTSDETPQGMPPAENVEVAP
jgi:hypothetical protein